MQQKCSLLLQFPDSVAPYMHFGNTMQRHFPGTFFRFPLRYGAPSPFHVVAYLPRHLHSELVQQQLFPVPCSASVNDIQLAFKTTMSRKQQAAEQLIAGCCAPPAYQACKRPFCSHCVCARVGKACYYTSD